MGDARAVQVCPSAALILARHERRLQGAEATWVEQHLQVCAACRRVASNLERAPARGRSGRFRVPAEVLAAHAAKSARFAERNRQARPPTLRIGQLWSTLLSTGDDVGADEIDAVQRIVLIVDSVWSHGRLDPQVAPIGVDVAYPADLDVAIGGFESPLSYGFIVQLWNMTPILEEQLGQFLGQLNPQLADLIGLVHRARLGEDVDLAPVRNRLGPAIGDQADPRLAFQERETAAMAYLREPFNRRLAVLERNTEGELEPDVVPVDTVGDLIRWGTADLVDVVPASRLERLWADTTPVDVLGDRERRSEPLLAAMSALGLTGETRDAFVERLLGLFGGLESALSGGQRRLYTRRQRGRGHGR